MTDYAAVVFALQNAGKTPETGYGEGPEPQKFVSVPIERADKPGEPWTLNLMFKSGSEELVGLAVQPGVTDGT
jgi:hypothetical protein